MKNRTIITEKLKEGGYSKKEEPITNKIYSSKDNTHIIYILRKSCSLGYEAIIKREERLDYEYVGEKYLQNLKNYQIQNLENATSVIDLVFNL